MVYRSMGLRVKKELLPGEYMGSSKHTRRHKNFPRQQVKGKDKDARQITEAKEAET